MMMTMRLSVGTPHAAYPSYVRRASQEAATPHTVSEPRVVRGATKAAGVAEEAAAHE